jgi:hypothetical protein
MARRPRTDPQRTAALAAVGTVQGQHLPAAALAASRAGCSLSDLAAAMSGTEEDAARMLRQARRDERDLGVAVVVRR